MNFVLENLNIKEAGLSIRFSFDIKIEEKVIGSCDISIGNSTNQITCTDGEQANFQFKPNKENYGTNNHDLESVGGNHADISCSFEQLTLPKRSNTEEQIAAFNISSPNDRNIDERSREIDSVENRNEKSVESSFYVTFIEKPQGNSSHKPLEPQLEKPHTLETTLHPTPQVEVEVEVEDIAGDAVYSYPPINTNKQEIKKNKRFQCEECGKFFKMKFDMKKHIKTVHLKLKPYKCEDCDKAFGHRGDLTRHVNDVHKGIKTFQCNQCGSCFKRKSHFVRHQNDHKGIRSFQCNDCGKLVASKSELNRHQVIHSGVKDFKCDKCGKCFALEYYLKNHIMVSHSEVKDFKCNECDKAYTSKTSLSRHQRRLHKSKK